MSKLSHINDNNQPDMVDVGDKNITSRRAIAQCRIRLNSEIMQLLNEGDIKTKKGPVFHTAIIAGISAAKKTSDLIPLCHNIPLDKVSITINPDKNNSIIITCESKTTHKTGVEMEALTGAAVAGLTIYDMCKAISHEIVIEEIKLMSKSGGKSDYTAK
jgi:cyclic pyranopterin monophosphate synthase